MIPEDKKLQLTDLLAIFPTGYTVEGDTDWTRESGLTWWCAYTEAELLHECNTIKDWARALLDGLGPIDVEYALGFANQELDALYDYLGCSGHTEEETTAWLADMIRYGSKEKYLRSSGMLDAYRNGINLDECKRRILNRIRKFFAIPLDGPDTENLEGLSLLEGDQDEE